MADRKDSKSMGKMSKEDLFREIGEINEAYIEEADRVKKSGKVLPWGVKPLVTAASLVLCVGLGYGVLQLTGGIGSSSDSAANLAGGIPMENAREECAVAEDAGDQTNGAVDGVVDGAAPQAQEPMIAGKIADEETALPEEETEATSMNEESGLLSDLQQSQREEKENAESDRVSGEAAPVESFAETLTESAQDAIKLTWEAACRDAVYGKYVDVEIPDGYTYTSGTRSKSALHVIWNHGMEEISISCRQADESVSDYLVDPNCPQEYDLELYTIPWCDSVPQDLISKVSYATFTPEQITQEIVADRSYQLQEEGDVSGWHTRIGILYSNNILVEIISKGPSPEEIYALINLEN